VSRGLTGGKSTGQKGVSRGLTGSHGIVVRLGMLKVSRGGPPPLGGTRYPVRRIEGILKIK
jgi:hypothetical protein